MEPKGDFFLKIIWPKSSIGRSRDSEDVGGGGRYPEFEQPVSGSICTNKLPFRRAHQIVLNDMYYGNLVPIMLKQTPTSDAEEI